MRSAAAHIGKARELLVEARYLLAGGFLAGAGRDAYLAGLHAALALIVSRTGHEPKTHNGARSEFSRLARSEPQITPEFVSFLGRSYDLKAWADYDSSEPMTREEVCSAFEDASRMVDLVEALLRADASS